MKYFWLPVSEMIVVQHHTTEPSMHLTFQTFCVAVFQSTGIIATTTSASRFWCSLTSERHLCQQEKLWRFWPFFPPHGFPVVLWRSLEVMLWQQQPGPEEATDPALQATLNNVKCAREERPSSTELWSPEAGGTSQGSMGKRLSPGCPTKTCKGTRDGSAFQPSYSKTGTDITTEEPDSPMARKPNADTYRSVPHIRNIINGNAIIRPRHSKARVTLYAKTVVYSPWPGSKNAPQQNRMFSHKTLLVRERNFSKAARKHRRMSVVWGYWGGKITDKHSVSFHGDIGTPQVRNNWLTDNVYLRTNCHEVYYFKNSS